MYDKYLGSYLTLLESAREEININPLKHRVSTHCYQAYTRPFGLGGYTHHRRAWFLHTPFHLQLHATLNLLDLLHQSYVSGLI